MLKLLLLFVLLESNRNNVYGVNLISYLSQHGLHGEISFLPLNLTHIEIKAKLETTLQYPEQSWNWAIHKFPVDYTIVNPNERCDLKNLGDEVINLSDDLGYMQFPGNETTSWFKEMNLTGTNGIWGGSVVLTNQEARICATITTIDSNLEHMAEARFNTPVAGSVYFRWLSSANTEHSDTLIYSSLYSVQESMKDFVPSTNHFWKIYVTDILKLDHHRTEENCNFLQLVFDPQTEGAGKGIGDLDQRLGKIKVATNAIKQEFRTMYRDDKLRLLPSDLTIPHRTLYLVLFDDSHPEIFLACAKIRHIRPILMKTFINGDGIKGEINFSQRSKFDPTFLNFTISSASKNREANREYAADTAGFMVHTLPPSPSLAGTKDYCLSTGIVYNPNEIEKQSIPPPGYGTQDQYQIGNLIGKLQSRNKDYPHNYVLPQTSELSGIYWDVFLPLQGVNSIAHRGIILYRYNRTDITNITETYWSCYTILHYEKNGIYQKPMFTAKAHFRYPIVGRVLFRQPKDEPWQDTTILIEYFIHADGSTQNKSDSHRWSINERPPGKDFYDWQNRCNSSGEIYNPFSVTIGGKAIDDFCKSWLPQMCRLGDLFNRLGSVSIAGNQAESRVISRKIFTERNLPLSGKYSILGKSLVIYDDFGPKARGDRLACSGIDGHYRRKAVAKEWHPNGAQLTVNGKIEIVQQSEYDISNIEVELKGLEQNSGYHVHVTPVEENLEFPCEGTSLYGHWNPRNVEPKLSPPPKMGSTDQYELGDLSGKFGTLDGYTQYEDFYNDTNLPLFGYESIVGRSIVIHKKEKGLRWACSTIERGYSPSEAREIRGIASFHNPNGYAYGYMRFSQLVYNDGSTSETVVEIKLRHPGTHDRNVTKNHNWQIYVNSVSVDATVKQTATRCVAGGYVWNPYYTQLADPLNTELYNRECGPQNPLRCYVGDMSARVGTLDLGVKRTVVIDSNLPLETPISAVGRSVVIFGPEKSWERYACANIEPDHHIVKYINLQRPPRFVVRQFLEETRDVLGVPEWMLNVDARQTKDLHGGACIQMIMHFKGPKAHQLEMDFSRLLGSGKLESPTLYIPGYINQKRKQSISYKTCGVRDPNEKKKSRNKLNFLFTSHGNQPKIANYIILHSILFASFIYNWRLQFHI